MASGNVIDLTQDGPSPMVPSKLTGLGPQVRKLHIRNRPSGPANKVKTDALSREQEYYVSVLHVLDKTLAHVLNMEAEEPHNPPQIASGSAFVMRSMQDLYKGIEHLCCASSSTYTEGIPWVEQAANMVMRHFTAASLQLKQRLESALCARGGLDSVAQRPGVLSMVLHQQAYAPWEQRMKVAQALLFYLDRTYLMKEPGREMVYELAWHVFDDALSGIHAAFLNDIASLVCQCRDKGITEWKGDDRRTEMLFEFIEMTKVLGWYEGPSGLNICMRQRTLEYYEQAASQALTSLSMADYLALVSKTSDAERRMSESLFHDELWVQSHVYSVFKAFVEDHVEEIVAGLPSLMRDKDKERQETALRLMFELLGRGSDGNEREPPKYVRQLRESYEKYWKDAGAAVLEASSGKPDLISGILSLYADAVRVEMGPFSGHSYMRAGSRSAFAYTINRDSTMMAELLARRADEVLRSRSMPQDGDAGLETQLDSIMEILRFLHSKDVFQAFYITALAKRLLLGKSTSSDAERSMLAKLRAECGSEFTKKMEDMFRDMEVSHDMGQAFKKSKLAAEEMKLKADLSVSLLSHAFWPTYPEVQVRLPDDMQHDLQVFSQFYLSQHEGRSLQWRHQLSHCVLRANFPSGGGRKELVLSLFQAIVLLAFNDVPEGGSLTYGELEILTHLPAAELERTLQSLALSRTRILLRVGKSGGKEIRHTDRFTVNTGFRDKMYRVKVNQVQLRETKEENRATHEQIQRDRMFELHAAIVRIMKARKTLSHTRLVRDTIDAVKGRGAPDVAEIKTAIGRLIEKEYLERSPTDATQYNYLA